MSDPANPSSPTVPAPNPVAGTSAPGPHAEGGPSVTRPGRAWLIKTVIMLVALWAFGFWALYDAMSLYPARGAKYAEFAEYQYLVQSNEAARLSGARVTNPTEAWATLDQKRRDAGEGALSDIEATRLDWLGALRLIGRLNEQSVAALNEDPNARLVALRDKWATADRPKRLQSYDIPSQWLILVVCWAIGLWILIVFIRVITTKYRWDADAKRLHLPGGATLTPADLAEVDKRKWDKFLVFLKINEGHEKLGRREIKLDLYRHTPLEAWVLEMERIAFPESASESAGQEGEGEAEDGAGENDEAKPDGASS